MDFLFSTDPLIRLQEALGRPAPTPFEILSLLGSVWGAILILGVARWFWGWRTLGTIALALALEAVVRLVVANLAAVARPEAPGLAHYGSTVTSSFPSGHVGAATALWWTAAARRRVPWIAAALVSLGTAIGRLYMGQHYVADVLAGIGLGLLAAWAAAKAGPAVFGWIGRRSFLLLVLVGEALAAAIVAGTVLFGPGSATDANLVGFVLGGAIALPVGFRWVRYDPGDPTLWVALLRLLLGLAGLAPPILLARFSGEAPGFVHAFAAFLAAGWVFLGAPLLFRVIHLAPGGAPAASRGERVTAWVLGALAAVLALGLVYGVAIEPRFVLDVREETVEIPHLPAEWDGAKIAAFGDLQVGMWLENEGMVERVAERVAEDRPDAVLFLGDLVYHAVDDPQAELAETFRLLDPISRSGIPIYAVLGNHDCGMARPGGEADAELAHRVAAALERAGIVVLRNRAVALRRRADGDPLYIVGLGAAWPDRDRPPEAFGDVPGDAPRVVFMHNPATFAKIGAHEAPLAVAGHTHGGQVRLPWTPSWSWLTFVKSDPVHADGWISGYGAPGNRLYVNRGIGFGVFPVRINCPPELTLFLLRRP